MATSRGGSRGPLGVLPRLLTPGARVAVVAPAGPLDRDRLERGVGWLQSQGWDVTVGAAATGRGAHGVGFLAASDAQRRSDLVAALLDPDVRAVIAGRGGNGTPRLLDDLPWDDLARAEPTIIAGLSDVTALHQAVAARLGWATLWSPMPATTALAGDLASGDDAGSRRDVPADSWSRQGLVAAMSQGPGEPLALRGTTLVDGPTVTAPLVGGTASVLSAMVGTPGHQPAAGAIAVLEDVGERAFRLERFLTHLRRGGFFDRVRGVAVGDLVDCRPAEEVGAVLHDVLGSLGVPVVAGLPFGHGQRQASLWLGRPATLDPSAGTLVQARPPTTDVHG